MMAVRSIDATLEALVRRDRQVVIAALTIVIALSWGYLLVGAGMPMTTPVSWTLGYAVLMFFMWWIMMLAMMLPSAAPMVLLFATVNRKQRETSHPYVATSVFALGYLAAWVGFSLVAVMLQWGFERTHLLSSPLVGANVILGGVLLFAAGVYQLTPIKHACLGHCRSPHAFLGTHWRQATLGALRMGLEHGAYCVGCCWFLMGLLFFGGVMNLYWIVGLALFVFFEKNVPAGHWLGYASGVALSVWGLATLVLAF
jgi:predicted metal-binding membrane protein